MIKKGLFNVTRRLNWQTIKRFIHVQFVKENNCPLHFALSVGFGAFWSITPIWGFQIIVAVMLAHFLKLNKALVFIGACLTIFPPVIPIVLYVSYKSGGWFMNNPSANISMENISLEFVKTNFFQYLIGSIFIAIIVGSVVTLLVWLIVSIKRKHS